MPTVREMLERHLTVTLPARGTAPRTIDSYRSDCRTHIYPLWEGQRIDRLLPEHIEEGVAQMLAEGLARSQVRKAHAILSSRTRIQVDRGNVARNPCSLVKPPKPPQSDHSRLTQPEVRAVRRGCRAAERGPLGGRACGRAAAGRSAWPDLAVRRTSRPDGWTSGAGPAPPLAARVRRRRRVRRRQAPAPLPEAVPQEGAQVRPSASVHPGGRIESLSRRLPGAREYLPEAPRRRPGLPRDQGAAPQDVRLPAHHLRAEGRTATLSTSSG